MILQQAYVRFVKITMCWFEEEQALFVLKTNLFQRIQAWLQTSSQVIFLSVFLMINVWKSMSVAWMDCWKVFSLAMSVNKKDTFHLCQCELIMTESKDYRGTPNLFKMVIDKTSLEAFTRALAWEYQEKLLEFKTISSSFHLLVHSESSTLTCLQFQIPTSPLLINSNLEFIALLVSQAINPKNQTSLPNIIMFMNVNWFLIVNSKEKTSTNARNAKKDTCLSTSTAWSTEPPVLSLLWIWTVKYSKPFRRRRNANIVNKDSVSIMMESVKNCRLKIAPKTDWTWYPLKKDLFRARWKS